MVSMPGVGVHSVSISSWQCRQEVAQQPTQPAGPCKLAPTAIGGAHVKALTSSAGPPASVRAASASDSCSGLPCCTLLPQPVTSRAISGATSQIDAPRSWKHLRLQPRGPAPHQGDDRQGRRQGRGHSGSHQVRR